MKVKRFVVWFYDKEEQCALLEFNYNTAEFGPLEYTREIYLDPYASSRHNEATNE